MKRKISLTISGGGARSSAGLGVIRYLEEHGYEVTSISGTSGGAILGILYAHGLNIEAIKDVLNGFKAKELFKPTMKSLFSLSGIEKDIREAIKGKEQKMPLTVCTTNIDTANEEYISTGDLIKNTIASCSLFPFFYPVTINGQLHADGGYTDNLPNLPLSNQKIPNISVNVTNPHLRYHKNKKNIKVRLFRIQRYYATKSSMERADLLVNVVSLAEINLFHLKKIDHCIEEGYNCIKSLDKELNALFDKKKIN